MATDDFRKKSVGLTSESLTLTVLEFTSERKHIRFSHILFLPLYPTAFRSQHHQLAL
jgi:hypothetical protein